jgi:ribose 5-phosphate isomerase B
MTDEEKIREMVRQVVRRAVGTPAPSKAGCERAIVTEQDLRDQPRGSQYLLAKGVLITPLARQVALERGISLVVEDDPGRSLGVRPRSSEAAVGQKSVAIGADHGGYQFKEMLKGYLQEQGYHVLDCGTDGTGSVDYPDFALAVGQLVARGRAARGILVDGAGIGSCMAANKVPGVRAAMCYDEATAVNSRAHNDANVLTLGAGMIGPALGRQIVKSWLEAAAESGRHARRVEKIMEIERRFLKRSDGG